VPVSAWSPLKNKKPLFSKEERRYYLHPERPDPVRSGNSLGGKGKALEFPLELNQSLKRFQEVTESTRGQHDRVAPTAYVFRDLQKPAPLILFEVEEEDFPFKCHLFGSDRIGAHSFPGILIHHIQTIAY
jgi:hypothetical protein